MTNSLEPSARTFICPNFHVIGKWSRYWVSVEIGSTELLKLRIRCTSLIQELSRSSELTITSQSESLMKDNFLGVEC